MKINKSYLYIFRAMPIAMLISGSNCAFAQLSSLQQPPTPASNQGQSSGNIIEKLFANPAANSSFASLNAMPDGSNPYASIEGVPKIGNNFWGAMFSRNIVNAGTMINGTLEDDLSSKKSKVGDVFSILLTQGYTLNNVQLIPANAKIVGAVSAVTPASGQRNGVTGSIQVSLQTLVLPDGSSMPISASIVYNPNQSKFDIKKGRGIPVGEYATSIEYATVGAVGSLTRNLGFPFPYKTQTGGGADFSLKSGELLPVKLIQPLDMTAYLNSQQAQASQVPNSQVLNAQGASAPAPNFAAPNLPAASMPTSSFVPPPQLPIYQNPSYPGAFPNSQPAFSSGSTLPGNTAPAGPEPF